MRLLSFLQLLTISIIIASHIFVVFILIYKKIGVKQEKSHNLTRKSHLIGIKNTPLKYQQGVKPEGVRKIDKDFCGRIINTFH